MSIRLRVLLVDDEGPARRGLRLRLKQFDDVEIVGECVNGREALAAVAELAPDLVFLDIQMPGMDGFEVVRRMQADNMPMLVFVTAYDHYAVSAFEVNAVDYILKPIEEERLHIALQRARQQLLQKLPLTQAFADKSKLLDMIVQLSPQDSAELQQRLEQDKAPRREYPEKITIRDAGETLFLKVADVDWVDAAGDYMCLHAKGSIHIMRITMKALEEQLDPALFQRVHRSTIVNMQRVERICAHLNGEYYLVLGSGERLRMSRTYKEKVQDFF